MCNISCEKCAAQKLVSQCAICSHKHLVDKYGERNLCWFIRGGGKKP